MLDIAFNIETREIVFENNDFKTTANPSVQNGGIALFSRSATVLSPMFGIGVEDFMGGNLSRAAFEMNRWQQMVYADGATKASWNAVPFEGSQVSVTTEVDYE